MVPHRLNFFLLIPLFISFLVVSSEGACDLGRPVFPVSSTTRNRISSLKCFHMNEEHDVSDLGGSALVARRQVFPPVHVFVHAHVSRDYWKVQSDERGHHVGMRIAIGGF